MATKWSGITRAHHTSTAGHLPKSVRSTVDDRLVYTPLSQPITATDDEFFDEPPLTVTGLENIDCMVENTLKVYLDAKPTPKSDVLATYEIEYSAQFRGDKYSAKRILHIGTCPFENMIDFIFVCG